MNVKIERDELLDLAQTYGFEFTKVVHWYTEFKRKYVCVIGGSDEEFRDAFEIFLSDRSSSEFINGQDGDLEGRSEEESAYYALYQVYGEKAYEDIPEEFRLINGMDEPMKM
jgi:hypothetical protein